MSTPEPSDDLAVLHTRRNHHRAGQDDPADEGLAAVGRGQSEDLVSDSFLERLEIRFLDDTTAILNGLRSGDNALAKKRVSEM